MKKYNFGGPNTIYRWMKKLGSTKQDVSQARDKRSLSGESSQSICELELEPLLIMQKKIVPLQ